MVFAKTGAFVWPCFAGRWCRHHLSYGFCIFQAIPLASNSPDAGDHDLSGHPNGRARSASGFEIARHLRHCWRFHGPCVDVHRQRQPCHALFILFPVECRNSIYRLVQGMAGTQSSRFYIYLCRFRPLGPSVLPASLFYNNRTFSHPVFSVLCHNFHSLCPSSAAGTEGIY